MTSSAPAEERPVLGARSGTGAEVWSRGRPRRHRGRLQWGSAVDGKRVYTANAKQPRGPLAAAERGCATSGVWSALDAAPARSSGSDRPRIPPTDSSVTPPDRRRRRTASSTHVPFTRRAHVRPRRGDRDGALEFRQRRFVPVGCRHLERHAVWGSGYSNFGAGTPNNKRVPPSAYPHDVTCARGGSVVRCGPTQLLALNSMRANPQPGTSVMKMGPHTISVAGAGQTDPKELTDMLTITARFADAASGSWHRRDHGDHDSRPRCGTPSQTGCEHRNNNQSRTAGVRAPETCGASTVGVQAIAERTAARAADQTPGYTAASTTSWRRWKPPVVRRASAVHVSRHGLVLEQLTPVAATYPTSGAIGTGRRRRDGHRHPR